MCPFSFFFKFYKTSNFTLYFSNFSLFSVKRNQILFFNNNPRFLLYQLLNVFLKMSTKLTNLLCTMSIECPTLNGSFGIYVRVKSRAFSFNSNQIILFLMSELIFRLNEKSLSMCRHRMCLTNSRNGFNFERKKRLFLG